MTTKKIFSISNSFKDQKEFNQLIDEFKKQYVTNYNAIYTKTPITPEQETYCLVSVGIAERTDYFYLYDGDELVGYFGLMIENEEVKVSEIYIKDKYIVTKHLRMIDSFVNNYTRENNRWYYSMEVFYSSKLMTKFKYLGIKIVNCYGMKVITE